MTLHSIQQSGTGAMQRLTGQIRTTPRWVVIFKGLFILTCLLAAIDGRNPPARAQGARDDGTSNVAVQASRVDDVIKRLDSLDARMSKQWDATNANANAIAGSQGETRNIFVLLGLLQGGTFVFQRKQQTRKSSGE